jgi:hypothetical protein
MASSVSVAIGFACTGFLAPNCTLFAAEVLDGLEMPAVHPATALAGHNLFFAIAIFYGISRAIYVTATGKRVVILRVFIKKTRKTPPRELEVARRRAKEMR